MSVQLKGDKTWRKMMLPEMSFLDSFDEFDGGVYDTGRWKPDLGFLNKQDAAVIWPPGYLHETSTTAPADGSCGSALTLQYAFPQPVQFLRAFLPRLSLSSEVGQCVASQWSSYATFDVDGIKPVRQMSKMRAQLEAIMTIVDSNKDDLITVAEAVAWLKDPRCLIRHSYGYRRHGRQLDLFIQFKAEDTVAYHDMDDDMVVSKQELWDSLVQWNVVRIRIKEGLKVVNRADRAALEQLERSLDYLRRQPITLPTNLRPELNDIFELKPGTKILPSLKDVHSFSDTEFFSNAREAVHDLKQHQKREL